MIRQEKQFGFSLLERRPLEELDGVMYRLRHDRTGLELVWIKREEENKTFGIAFETLPKDDTGVFHILEHSVLCGSKRYPVKDPFVELMKSSMNTFLNAMTFPDKTVYPISSRNGKDFFNLMRVYLDAVFAPNIYEKPEIFWQEGWHYAFDDDGTPAYRGVVFNEMKGVFADEGELLDVAMNRALFPQSPYQYVSGGDPEKIPDLTYDAFLQSHRTFYSPSNAYVFLDGNVEIQTVLQILEEEYLCRLKPGSRIAPPAMQAAVDGGSQEIMFEIGPDEDASRRAGIAWGRVIGSYREREKIIAMQLLADVLCGDNHSPLNKALLGAELAEKVSMEVVDGIAQPWVKLRLHNLNGSYLEKAKGLLITELERQAAGGLDHENLKSTMANLEFRLRERDFGTMPQGLAFGMQALESWLYGGDPAANLTVGNLFERLRQKLDEGYFEDLIRQALLENDHRCEIRLIPSYTAGMLRQEKEKARLNGERARWSERREKEFREQEARLLRSQQTEDTEEACRSLPHLALSDIADKPEKIPAEITETTGVRVIHHPIKCGDITYFTLYFDVEDCTEEELSCLAFLCRMIGQLDTDAHTAQELTAQIRLLCGDLQLQMSAFHPINKPQSRVTKLCLSYSTLTKNAEAATALVAELLIRTKFKAEDTALNVLRQIKIQMFQQMLMSGSSTAMGRIEAQVFAAGMAGECAGGFTFYKWLGRQERSKETKGLLCQCEKLAARVFSADRLTLSVTGESHNAIEEVTAFFAHELPRGEKPSIMAEMNPWGARKEAIVIPADISFAVAGGNLACCGGKYTGAVRVAARIVSLAYLWNTVRVEGGAYGTGLSVTPSGLVGCYSYRDPSAARSLGIYQKAGAFLRSFGSETENLTDFIIGAASEAAPLLTPRMKGLASDGDYWRGISYEMRCEEKGEMLRTTPAMLKSFAEDLENVLQSGGFCVIGAKDQIDACGTIDLLENL